MGEYIFSFKIFSYVSMMKMIASLSVLLLAVSFMQTADAQLEVRIEKEEFNRAAAQNRFCCFIAQNQCTSLCAGRTVLLPVLDVVASLVFSPVVPTPALALQPTLVPPPQQLLQLQPLLQNKDSGGGI